MGRQRRRGRTADAQPEADAAQRAARDRGRPGLYFGGVAFKYQRPVADLERAARLARDYVDVITTSGPGTGQAAEPAKLAAIRDGAGDHPLALPSGVTPENVAGYLPWVDAYLVATSIGHDFEHLAPGRTRALVESVHDRSGSAAKGPLSTCAGPTPGVRGDRRGR